MFKRWFTKNSVEKNDMTELNHRLAEVERMLKTLSESEIKHTISVDTLHIHNPVLENLTFRLDKLDIEEVSGALNLGNNFGMRIHQKPKFNRVPTPNALTNTSTDGNATLHSEDTPASSGMEETAQGYRFKF